MWNTSAPEVKFILKLYEGQFAEKRSSVYISKNTGW